MADRKIVLVGNPNVGKSVIFRLLTGSYVMVSNFPGTTVEVSRGRLQSGGLSWEIVDTPGIYSCVPQSEDERVTCEILLREKPNLFIQVADAKNLRRTLLVTSQLVEFGIPVVLVLNMVDEAEERGIEIDAQAISNLFAIPVVETVAIYSRGRKKLLQAIAEAGAPQNPLDTRSLLASDDAGPDLPSAPAALTAEWLSLEDRGFTRQVESAMGETAVRHVERLSESYRTSHNRSLARAISERRRSFLDETVQRVLKRRQARYIDNARSASRVWMALLIAGIALFAWNEAGTMLGLPTPNDFVLERATGLASRWVAALGTGAAASLVRDLLLGEAVAGRYTYGLVPELVHVCMFLLPVVVPFGILLVRNRGFTHEMGILTRRPSTGIPILVVTLLLVYEFVGYTGAQTLVGLLEKTVFGAYAVPAVSRLLPATGWLTELLVGKYGVVSMGLTYAIAIVLPVVATFFVAFGLLEDSGYLPRLAILSDRVMRIMGLNGKATLPMVLGLGCCTMATITTRILNSPKERLIATLLLALGIPCSAQLGVILGISASFSFKATLVVLGVVMLQLFLVGFLSSRLVRGRCSEFLFEIPPIRVPQLRNVVLKTAHRIRWYLWEAVPLFLYGTLALFVLDKVHVRGASLLAWIQKGMEPVTTGILHLPAQAAGVFVLGFLRRDYGAAGLFQMVRAGLLTGSQAVVSLIVITLFVPCLASFLVIVKEQGVRRALVITGFIIPFALSVGAAVSWVLRTFEITF